MAHINDLYEAQSKALLHDICDALGIADSDRTPDKIRACVKVAARTVDSCEGCGAVDCLNGARSCEHCEVVTIYSDD